MSLLGQMFAGDEELGKKNDDHRPLNGDAKSAAWSARKSGRVTRWRKIIYGLCGILFIYLLTQNIPDLSPTTLRDTEPPRGPIGTKKSSSSPEPPKRKPPRPPVQPEAEDHYHDGPIKFYKLAASLHAVARMGGQQLSNKNILFAASSLKSVSEIIPLACEMARWERNDVHLALMGRDEMELEEIKQINGAVEDCNVNWHDARPDFARWSSDFRMEVSVTAAMEHIQTFVHPQMIIIDDPTREDGFFVDSIRSKALDLGKSIIELPRDAAETMMWMTRLDSGSLAAWPTTYVDIFIQAPKDSSGSLVRLLKSIEEADYFGARRPHLTIELPADVDQATWRYLQNFIWPPPDFSGAPHASQVTLRHRIPRRTVSAEEASARLVESFYPVRTDDSNVLLLSPQVQLSPLYYHFLLYTLLEYKYSDYSKKTKEGPDLMGISLALPSTFPNDTTQFVPPRRSSGGEEREKTPFRWQMPNADAVLYFGTKWMEFHSFLSNRLSKPPTDDPKIFSESHPAWLEYMLELMRARGYSLLYPNFDFEDTALATVHSDLFQVPEEFLDKKSKSPSTLPSTDSDFTVDPGAIKSPPNVEKPLLSSSLVSLLPSSGDLPELGNLPLLDFQGETITNEASGILSFVFTNTFRGQMGGCADEKEQSPRYFNSANDLFCHLEEIYDYHAAAVDSSIITASSLLGDDTSIKETPGPLKVLPKPDAFVRDEDVMSHEAADEAKTSGETTNHLNRHNNIEEVPMIPKPVIPNRDKIVEAEPPRDRKAEAEAKELYDSLHPGKSEVDAGDEWQTQFRGQMERQRKQAMKSTAAKDEEKVSMKGNFNKTPLKPVKEEGTSESGNTDEKKPGW